MTRPSYAIVYEWLNGYGGGERVLAEVLDMHPDASIFSLIYSPHHLAQTPLGNLNVHTSFMQSIPRVDHLYRWLLPFMPLAAETLNVKQHDIVISLSHAVAHSVKTNANQLHISYIATPMRYAWHLQDDYLRLHRLNRPFLNFASRVTLSLLRRWDVSASARSDHLLANSHWTAEKIRQAWGRDAAVIYPPVHIHRFDPALQRDDFYLHVARLVPYKLTVEIVKAFNELKLPLVIVGDGPEIGRVMQLAGASIRVLGPQPDSVVNDLMNRARAFVYMATEDFGIVMAEAQAAGCPVIAYQKGGAAEIVRDGETGLLFSEQTSRGMIDAVLRSQKMELNSKAAQENAARFSSIRFRREFFGFVEGVKRA